jgi:hypothetical protein
VAIADQRSRPAFGNGDHRQAAGLASGLGHIPESQRPLEATLWGEPRTGRAEAKLGDGTRIRWRDREWSVDPSERVIRFAARAG